MIKGRVVIDKKTKNLVKRIRANEIAIIDHKDIDQVAGLSLIERQVKAVFNLSKSISGRYPNLGPNIILNKGIPIVDIYQGDLFSLVEDGDQLSFSDGYIYKEGQIIGKGKVIDNTLVETRLEEARSNLTVELSKFIDNTLSYALKEKKKILDLPVPNISIDLNCKHVLIVIRGINYKNDLEAVNSYIHDIKPVIIAVDGGADACLEKGYIPDIIIGDMDSVSDNALRSCRSIVVHAYPDGRAPGLKRVKKLGIEPILFPALGTSEDIAMLLAYEKGAELITLVGSHSHLIDFLEKGREGMASTLLVRLKIGDKLVDAKGVSKLYQNKIHYHYWIQIIISVLLPLSILGFFSPPIKQLFRLLALKINLIFHQ